MVESSLHCRTWALSSLEEKRVHETKAFHGFFLTRGEVDILVNGKQAKLRAGEGMLLSRHQLYKIISFTEDVSLTELSIEPTELFSTALKDLYVTPNLSPITRRSKVLHPAHLMEKKILDTLDKIARHMNRPSDFSLLEATLQFAVIWRYWIQQDEETPLIGQERMRTMLQYIHDHSLQKITLDQIAHSGRLSRSECCRYFANWVGKSPLAYANDIKMQEAATLLTHSDESIAEIANRLGFTSVSHFVQTFRKSLAVTPLVYRKKNKK